MKNAKQANTIITWGIEKPTILSVNSRKISFSSRRMPITIPDIKSVRRGHKPIKGSYKYKPIIETNVADPFSTKEGSLNTISKEVTKFENDLVDAYSKLDKERKKTPSNKEIIDSMNDIVRVFKGEETKKPKVVPQKHI